MTKKQIIWAKFKMFWRELGNFLTNILCPILSLVAAATELLQLPADVTKAVKTAEYWCWYACGTKAKLDEIVEVVEEKFELEDKGE